MKEKLIELINKLLIDQDRKDYWLKRIEDEGVSETLTSELLVEHQGFAEGKMEEAGLLEGEEYEVAKEEMKREVESAEADLEGEMVKIEKGLDEIQKDISAADAQASAS